ncbi:hypothetical protein PNIG_b0123 [Pseudoalteromonas nigrifaciens]|uniref:Lipoprotein n=1 Tax=Pseudoalteromonas nigrifaciens TaxID=28109 RepID=A0AAC9UJY1_9GAMM|nr:MULTISPECIES: hypothetical protein [Pseudoalteromonas]ASM55770.1 hypothetical protein PNIG_b0123 [Pseudoalteromonas nigrifaciens]MBH0072227.1 hypothetical protein [Pseudoalteromonas sp. NZS127]MBH0092173.1 hypothetical protein [Pseudoalteromonas sp. SCQQ13]NYR14315.1 hypothetical protein [Pseudoalteromonas sp. MIP2626]WMS96244.1 hypothetical protein RB215_17760 [Pseudoalteromonas sp. HL-AS2]|tara:strand:+ start:2562 stop:3233 length:672 start_codon:yes stop_codon:yes gene_type:complete
MLKKLTITAAFLSILSGCTIQNSFPVEYHKKTIENVEVKNIDSIGVTQWRDKRNLATVKDELAEKAVMRMGPATIGMTSDGQEFVRVADFIRNAFINELQSLGVNAKKIDIIPASSDAKLLSNIAINNQVEMLISADLMSFDVNCHGAWTLDCNRNVSFSLSLVNKLGEELITRELFDATMANNEGMGVLHKTLLDQLTNEVMRSALKKAVIRTVEEINKQSK